MNLKWDKKILIEFLMPKYFGRIYKQLNVIPTAPNAFEWHESAINENVSNHAFDQSFLLIRLNIYNSIYYLFSRYFQEQHISIRRNLFVHFKQGNKEAVSRLLFIQNRFKKKKGIPAFFTMQCILIHVNNTILYYTILHYRYIGYLNKV